MCDKECRERFQRIEMTVNGISTDMKWFKRLAGALLILVGAALGIDTTALV